jgi:long-chain acyl-CoA synthetase
MLIPLQPVNVDPEKVAFQMCESGEQVTYAQLNNRANQVAHLISDLGILPGDHVAVLMNNCRELMELCFGLDRSGVYYTLISTRLTTDEMAYIVQDCGARLFVYSSALELADKDLFSKLPNTLNCMRVGPSVEQWKHKDWTAECSKMPTSANAQALQGGDMLYSSGTTGRPKGVLWPLPKTAAGQHTMLVKLLAPLFGYDADCHYLSTAPLYHAAPLRHSMTVIKLGGTVTVMERFDALLALQTIERCRITHSQWVPTMFVRLLKLDKHVREKFDLSSMKMAVHAAAPCPVDVKEQMIGWWGPIVHEYYAGTENNGFCSITPNEWLQHKGSVGRASQGKLHICDEEGMPLEVGQTGAVYFSEGPQFTYHNDSVSTEQTRNSMGWTTLGDIGYLDEEGYLYLVDRKAFMIISGGVNIYPQEIENVLLQHPKVMDAAVVGVPSSDWGEEVKAVVQPVDPLDVGPVLAAELQAFCREKLADFKCPRSIDFDLELPRLPTGKLYKKLVKKRYWPQ